MSPTLSPNHCREELTNLSSEMKAITLASICATSDIAATAPIEAASIMPVPNLYTKLTIP